MIGWIAIIIGVLIFLGLSWIYRKEIKKFWKQNKKKVIALGASSAMIGVGASGLIIPEGYRPRVETMIRTSDGRYWSATAANFQTAINSLTSGTVWTPNVNMTVTSSIYGKTGVNLVGDRTTLFLGDSADVKLLYLHDVNNLTVSGITFRINNDSNTAYVNAISLAETSENITIRDCYFYNGIASFIDVQETTRHITIRDCHFDGIQIDVGKYPAAVWLSGEHCKVLDNYIEDTFANGVQIEANSSAPSSKYHIVDGNTFTGRIGYAIAMDGRNIQTYMKSSNCTITNNIIYDLNSTAFLAAEGYYGNGIAVTENSTCSNNIIKNVDRVGILVRGNNSIVSSNVIDNVRSLYGIRVTTEPSYIVISDCSIKDIANDGISIDSAAINVIVKGTLFKNISDSGIASNARILIVSDCTFEEIYGTAIDIASGTTNATITGNSFENIEGGYAIYTSALSPSIITNNYIYDVVRGIYVLSHWNIISNNIITSCTSDAINIHNSKNNTIMGNVIKQSAADGIELDDCFNSTLIGNHVSNCVNGIRETGTSQGNIVLGNIVELCTTSEINLNLAGDTIYAYNKGTVS